MLKLVDHIYEASVAPERWPNVLCEFGEKFNTKGALIFSANAGDVEWVGGGEAGEIMRDFISAGWMEQNRRVSITVASGRAGFLTDLDTYTEQELDELPMYREFLRPRGVSSAAGSYVSGLLGEDLLFTVEGFADHQAARDAVPALDGLRPHIARAVVLSAQLGLARAYPTVEALELLATPAAIVSSHGALCAANELFQAEVGVTIFDHRSGIALPDAGATRQLSESLAAILRGAAAGRSIALRGVEGRAARVLHILPLRGVGRDLFGGARAILIVGRPKPRGVVQEGLLSALFDLTPAEARLAQALTAGMSPREAAQAFGLSVLTVRTQMKGVLSKTGFSRQGDLMSLLRDLALPAAVG